MLDAASIGTDPRAAALLRVAADPYSAAFADAVAAGLVVARAEFARREIAPARVAPLALTILAAALVGGRAAARADACGLGALGDAAGLLDGRAGSAYLGGWIAAALASAVHMRVRAIPLRRGCDALAPAAALAYAIGRVGCHLAGDGCYGTPTDLPWAVAYVNGSVPCAERVHPTPLYESLASLAIFALLRRSRKTPRADGASFALYLVLAAVARFAIELLRRNARHAGLSQAQWIALAMLACGSAALLALARPGLRARASRGRTVSVGEPDRPA